MSRSRRMLALALIAVLGAGAVRLGIWQLHRLAERRANNRLLLAARDLPVIDLNQPGIRDSSLAGRRVGAWGHFRAAGTVLLRNREFRDAPGLYVVTPFAIDGDTVEVWALRGFVNAANAVTPRRPLPAFATGRVRISGIADSVRTTLDGGHPLALAGDTTWQRLDRAVLAERAPRALGVYLYLESPDSMPGGLPPIAAPTLDEGPHLAYAVQWFLIALAILTFGLVVLRPPADRERAPPL